MAAYRGDKVKIKKNGVVICSGINQKDISISAELIDDTANSNRGYSVSLAEPDTKSITLGFSGIAKSRILRKYRLMDENLLTGITYEFANGDTITGSFIISDYSESGAVGDAIKFSCSLRSSGAYVFAFSSSEDDDGGGGGGAGEPLDGKLNSIGSMTASVFSSNGMEVGEGMLYGTAVLFDSDVENITHIYQRYRVLDEEGSEIQTIKILAIDGDFAICGIVGGGIFISPYNIDDEILTASAWETNCTLQYGTGYEIIDSPEDYNSPAIMMISRGKFVILNSSLGKESIKFQVINYASPTDINVQLIEVPLSSIGLSGSTTIYNNYMLEGAINLGEDECCFMGGAVNYDTFEQNIFILKYKYSDFSLLGYLVIENIDASPLAGLTQPIQENYFSYTRVSDYYYSARGDFGGVCFNSGGSGNYNAVISFFRYGSREIVDNVLIYNDQDDDEVFSANDLVSAKLNSLGFDTEGFGYSSGIPSLFLT